MAEANTAAAASEYKAVIGLEVHAELATDSKIYCGCSTTFGGEENSPCLPGLPGDAWDAAVIEPQSRGVLRESGSGFKLQDQSLLPAG
jgi:hypothetical protein